MQANPDQHIFMARVAEQAQDYEEMTDQLLQLLAKRGLEITSDERNLLSIAFKNQIAQIYVTLQNVHALMESKDETIASQNKQDNSKTQKIQEKLKEPYIVYGKVQDAGKSPLKRYEMILQDKIYDKCMRVISQINEHVLEKKLDFNDDLNEKTRSGIQQPQVSRKTENLAFFKKLVGDYYTYIAQNVDDERFPEAFQNALNQYDKITELNLPFCHPITQGIALNRALLTYKLACNFKFKDESYYQLSDEIKMFPQSSNIKDKSPVHELRQSILNRAKDEANKSAECLMDKNYFNLSEDDQTDLKIITDTLKENVLVWQTISFPDEYLPLDPKENDSA
ncbi:UNKNOWN [Stylonychia lemnae]|uniref:14-3-3 domain-containing protein n=1 Tax=Stylonychia lemnae TaxID=5949 RepID=A0A077ZW77_STYLE|nr:UNKNOWN [Stylonychia lemnae]|eukprot:CDW74124.1 UNKNOWN [Stylonychia lemnae]